MCLTNSDVRIFIQIIGLFFLILQFCFIYLLSPNSSLVFIIVFQIPARRTFLSFVINFYVLALTGTFFVTQHVDHFCEHTFVVSEENIFSILPRLEICSISICSLIMLMSSLYPIYFTVSMFLEYLC